jgi:hypothetical protein
MILTSVAKLTAVAKAQVNKYGPKPLTEAELTKITNSILAFSKADPTLHNKLMAFFGLYARNKFLLVIKLFEETDPKNPPFGARFPDIFMPLAIELLERDTYLKDLFMDVVE